MEQTGKIIFLAGLFWTGFVLMAFYSAVTYHQGWKPITSIVPHQEHCDAPLCLRNGHAHCDDPGWARTHP